VFLLPNILPLTISAFTIFCYDGGDTDLTLYFRVNHDTNGDWLGKDNLNCSQVYLDSLEVINSDDHTGGSEYYINLNGHHLTLYPFPNSPAAGTRIWTDPGTNN
jgi:hypothetical protein